MIPDRGSESHFRDAANRNFAHRNAHLYTRVNSVFRSEHDLAIKPAENRCFQAISSVDSYISRKSVMDSWRIRLFLLRMVSNPGRGCSQRLETRAAGARQQVFKLIAAVSVSFLLYGCNMMSSGASPVSALGRIAPFDNPPRQSEPAIADDDEMPEQSTTTKHEQDRRKSLPVTETRQALSEADF